MIEREDPADLFAAQPAPAQAAAAGQAEPIHEIRLPSADASSAVGARLRAARTQQGLTLADCAARLHLPVKVLERLEADDFGTSEHFVFLRGALTGYAKLLGLPPDSCTRTLRAVAPATQPALTSVARTSQFRWLLQRYGTAATYIVLTATIAVPLVLLGLRGGLERPSARIVSLDQAPQATVAKHQAQASPDASPFRASMTPFAAIGLTEVGPDDGAPATATAAPVVAPAAAADQGRHVLTIVASADCWFEITGADGNKIDSGMLHAGDSRTWHANGELHVTLGNASGVTVTRDGQPLVLDAYRNANVARFNVFGPAASSGEND